METSVELTLCITYTDHKGARHFNIKSVPNTSLRNAPLVLQKEVELLELYNYTDISVELVIK